MIASFRLRLGYVPARDWWLMVLAAGLLLACGRPLDRPLEGARPTRAGEAAQSAGLAVPPTLSAGMAESGSTLSAVPQATVINAASPAPTLAALAPTTGPSPGATTEGRNPILSGLQPGPNTVVQAGPVAIAARVAAASDLAEASLLLNGAPIAAQITRQDPRNWSVGYTGRLDPGRYDVRINAKDQDGRAGGFRWQFDVGIGAGSTPRPASPVPRL